MILSISLRQENRDSLPLQQQQQQQLVFLDKQEMRVSFSELLGYFRCRTPIFLQSRGRRLV